MMDTIATFFSNLTPHMPVLAIMTMFTGAFFIALIGERLAILRRIIVCVGQGRWEDELLESTRHLDEILCSKHVPAWFDYWGYDVDHDWCWWRRQLAYFMQKVLENEA